jgi:TnpA family transposase
VIFFGKGGDIATNRRDEQELSVLCLRVLQAALVYVNTLRLRLRCRTSWPTTSGPRR